MIPRASLIICIAFLGFAAAKQVVLLDTRTSSSELGWKTHSVSRSSEEGWLEETFTDLKAGNNYRAFVVCEVDLSNVDNWLRTPYIPRGQANRLFVRMTFSMRDCSQFSRDEVRTCGETFTLLYHETNAELAEDALPPWKETSKATEGYKSIDRVAGDRGRFSQHAGAGEAESVENVEVRDIPVSKNGVYLAFRDQGACTSILGVRVYYEVCAETTAGLAVFPETAAGAEQTSLVPASGTCVDYARPKSQSDAKSRYLCKSDGTWDLLSGGCLCQPGFFDSDRVCLPCQSGEFSLGKGDGCRACPGNSESRSGGSGECACRAGFYRASSEGAEAACSQPPSRPLDARVESSSESSAVVRWTEPSSKGGRAELWYRAECKDCPSGTQFSPGTTRFNQTSISLTNLLPNSEFTLFIYAENQVTEKVETLPMYAVVEVSTAAVLSSSVRNVRVLSASTEDVTLGWESSPGASEYQVEFVETNRVGARPLRVSAEAAEARLANLKNGTEYRIRVRALSGEGWSSWSAYAYAKTAKDEAETRRALPGSPEKRGPESESTGTIVLIIVGCVIVLCLVVLGILYATRRRNGPSDHRKQPSDLDVLDYRAGGHLTPDYPHGGHHFGPAAHEHTLGKKMTAPLMPTMKGRAGGGASYKPYIDPFAYEDPNVALREFALELDPQFLFIEHIILGGGEFGEVHQGKLKLPGRAEEIVAIKSLLPNATTKAKEDFLQEAAVMGQFDHPNVIRLKGVLSRSDPAMIVTEFMANKSLDHFLRLHDGALSIGDHLAILRGICAGMKYLSDKGYVHRDLAARNVLVNESMMCKISDFGLSRGMNAMGSSEQVYHTKGGKIPVRWTAPEAITHRKYTSASDVWSMGIVIWEVASYGERPYWDWSNQEVIKSVETGYRLPPPMNCPQGLHSLMLDCWRRDRNERPNFGAIVRRLDEFARIPDLIYAPNSTANSTLSSELYDHTSPPSQYHHAQHHSASTLSTPMGGSLSPSPQAPPPPAPLQPPPLPSLDEFLGTLGLAHFASSLVANGVDSVAALTRLGIVDLMTYGLGQVDCQRIRDSVSRLTATSSGTATLPSRRHPPLPALRHHHSPSAFPSVATLHAPGRPPVDQGYFI